MNVIKAGIKFLHFLEDSSLVSLILALLVLSVMQIVLRNLGIAGFMWAETATRVLVLWMAFFGAMRASRIRNHIAIDVVSHYAPLPLQRVLHFIVCISCAVICGIAAYYSWDFVRDEYQSGMIAFLNIPVWLTEAIIPFGLSIITLRFILQCLSLPPTEDEEASILTGTSH